MAEFKTVLTKSLLKNTYDHMPRFSKLDPQAFVRGDLSELGKGKGVKICVVGSGAPDHGSLTNVYNAANLTASEEVLDHDGSATITASIIGSCDTNNIVGIAPEVGLYFAKASESVGTLSDTAIAAGIIWGVVIECNIIVVPNVPSVLPESILQAIEKAKQTNTLVIFPYVEGQEVPSGVMTPEKLIYPDQLILSANIDHKYCEVVTSDFGPAILAGVAALMVEKRNTEKKTKVSQLCKQLKAILESPK